MPVYRQNAAGTADSLAVHRLVRGWLSSRCAQLLIRILPERSRVTSCFSRFSGRGKYCPPALRCALRRIM
ncbi:hypothetical protein OA43_15945 [Klebsiella variicola]|nr:hypothetical protein OA43_15945 [Klebsiella variicola]KLF72698.1 hypothetical protein YA38_07435 [Klebsiella aerogenes]